jgi:hypothetical protein
MALTVEIAHYQRSHLWHLVRHLPLHLRQLIQMQPLISLVGAMEAIPWQQVRHTQCLLPVLLSLRNGAVPSLVLHIRLLVQPLELLRKLRLLLQAQQ